MLVNPLQNALLCNAEGSGKVMGNPAGTGSPPKVTVINSSHW